MEYIELFAGCGGLSLGLKAAGFNNIMANELSPMAAETYAFNFHNENLSDASFIDKNPLRTVWLSSNHPLKDMSLRLREDPRLTPPYDSSDGYCDLISQSSLKDKLVVGSIKELNRFLTNNPGLLASIKNPTLVSGGPPCQSFSLAGLRQKDNSRNTLPLDFINFVKMTSPKIALLENVTGILKPFKKEGDPYYAWFEIAKGFKAIGYVPLCLYVNAQLAGVPQLRKRFILIAIKQEHADAMLVSMNPTERELMQLSIDFMHEDVAIDCLSSALKVHDLTCSESNADKSDLRFLRSLLGEGLPRFTVKDAIDDLSDNTDQNYTYRDFIYKRLSGNDSPFEQDKITNNENRVNKPLIKRRFRIYQVLSKVPVTFKNEVMNLLRGKTDYISSAALDSLLTHKFLTFDDELKYFNSNDDLESYLRQHHTKKNSQKALLACQPSPSALSIPDDFCHYSESQLRTLTVREMARIQSFPDSFVFRSKVTTGGANRRFEVPQYTQVGNAIPPLLGYQLGLTIRDMLALMAD